jgi:hypothetical protein
MHSSSTTTPQIGDREALLSSHALAAREVFAQKGAKIIDGRSVEVSGGLVRIARLADEWFEDLDDPAAFVRELKRSDLRADVFTFWQRLPFTEPRYQYLTESETIAVLRVTTYEHWYKSQINNKTRNLLVKAGKKGVVVRETVFDDKFAEGITAIFNETPVRQERPFHHYGKSVGTVRREFSRFLFRETMIGAYLEDELIGFIMLADAGKFATLTQIISLIRHRDKSPQNALLAKAIEVCAARQTTQLVYALWPRGPLRDFKKHNGFGPVNLPRYYVPLNVLGQLALKMKLHRSPVEMLPEPAVMYLRGLRSKVYAFRHRDQFSGKGAPPPSSQGAG